MNMDVCPDRGRGREGGSAGRSPGDPGAGDGTAGASSPHEEGDYTLKHPT